MQAKPIAMPNNKPDIREASPVEISSFIAASGEKAFRANQLYEWLWVKGARSFDEMSSLPKTFRDTLQEHFEFRSLQTEIEQQSRDKTVKSAFRLSDGHLVEGVLIPSPDRVTACISTQVGCAMNCGFCATGAMGFTRNLSAGEIFDQFSILNRRSIDFFGIPLSNLVVMGMGEPFLNFDNLMAAMGHICDPKGINFSPTRITVSTIGIAEGIRAFADAGTKINLSISLHTANENLRTDMMPASKKHNMSRLRDAIRYYHSKTGMRITYEYILFGGLNDSPEHAQALAEFCKISPCKINIIEYNSTGNKRFTFSPVENRDAFVAFLETKNLIVNIRRSKGRDIDAACGQLAGNTPRLLTLTRKPRQSEE